MKFRVVVRAYSLRRDIASGYLFSEALRSMGCKTYLSCVRNFDILLKYWAPHAAVINTTGKINHARMHDPGIRVLQWPGEGAQLAQFSDANWISRQGDGTIDKVDRLLLWGEHTRRIFLDKFGTGIDSKIRVCGNPRLDLVKFRKFPDPSERKSVGFIGRYAFLNYYDKRAPASELIMSPDGVSRMKILCEQFAQMVKIIDKIVEKTSLNVSIRPHPLEAPEGYEKFKTKHPGRVTVDAGFDFADWVARQKLIVTPASSSFIEPYLLRIPIVNTDHMLENENTMAKREILTSFDEGTSYRPRSMDELLEMLSGELKADTNSEVMNKYLADVHNWPSEGSAIMKAAEGTLEVLNEGNCQPSGGKFPDFIIDALDRIRFFRAKHFAGCNHENFNYRHSYHKFPAYFGEILENMLKNKPVWK